MESRSCFRRDGVAVYSPIHFALTLDMEYESAQRTALLSVSEGGAMLEARLTKVAMVACVALFAFIVTFDNITDYDSNFQFVAHVMSMDTVFPNNALMYRSITSRPLWHLAYWLIIGGEGLTCLMFSWGAVRLTRSLRGSSLEFKRSKRPIFMGATIGFLVWFLGFMVVGGEWFAMWQSKVWNGQEAAFRFYLTLIGVLIFVNQPDTDIAS
jgi:predicted small integral membrane protein